MINQNICFSTVATARKPGHCLVSSFLGSWQPLPSHTCPSFASVTSCTAPPYIHSQLQPALPLPVSEECTEVPNLCLSLLIFLTGSHCGAVAGLLLTHYEERAVSHRNPPASVSPVLELKSAAMSNSAPLSTLATCYSTPYSSAERPTFFTTAVPHSRTPSLLIYLGRSGSSLNHQFKYLPLCSASSSNAFPFSLTGSLSPSIFLTPYWLFCFHFFLSQLNLSSNPSMSAS